MGVFDGQSVNQAVTNPAFINKNQDDVMPNKLGFTRTLSGGSIADIQQAVNNIYTATGVSETETGTDYNAPPGTFANGAPYLIALRALAGKFDSVTGHQHSGNAGDAPPIAASAVGGVPLLAYTERQAFGTFAITGGSSVQPPFFLKLASTGFMQTGVPSTPQLNQVYVRGGNGQEYVDSTGYLVYGRLTYATTGAASGWLLSFYSAPAGIEQAYTFQTSAQIDFFFQELFNPLLPTPPTYTFDLIAKNQNITQSVIPATTGLYGKAILATSSPADIAATGSSGTANGIVANANHTHRGVTSVAVTGGSPAYGAITLIGSGVSQLGSSFTFTGGSGGGGSLEWVESAASPESVVENNNRVYLYDSGDSQALYALIKVPTGFTAGSPVKMKLDFYSPDTSGNALLQTVATLIRQGTDLMSSTTNQRTSTNSAVTLSGGTQNIPQGISFDLSSSTGTINGVTINPGDFINVKLTRGTDTAASDLRVPVFGTEVTFS